MHLEAVSESVQVRWWWHVGSDPCRQMALRFSVVSKIWWLPWLSGTELRLQLAVVVLMRHLHLYSALRARRSSAPRVLHLSVIGDGGRSLRRGIQLCGPSGGLELLLDESVFEDRRSHDSALLPLRLVRRGCCSSTLSDFICVLPPLLADEAPVIARGGDLDLARCMSGMASYRFDTRGILVIRMWRIGVGRQIPRSLHRLRAH